MKIPAMSGGGGSHTYSTTEQAVGTWIDGSTLYEKTIQCISCNVGGYNWKSITANNAIPAGAIIINGSIYRSAQRGVLNGNLATNNVNNTVMFSAYLSADSYDLSTSDYVTVTYIKS